jgi:hypothetical protein
MLRCRPRTQGHVHSGGLNHLEGFLPLPSGATTFPSPAHPLWPNFLSCVNFLSVFVLFMFDVLAHILIFGSVHPLYASYIYVLCLPAHPFPTAFPSCVFLSSLLLCTHPSVPSIWRAISLLLFPFLLQDHRLLTDLATSCVKNWRN